MKLWFSLFMMELKRQFAYRADFWMSFLVSLATEWGIAYSLWSAIFFTSGQERIGGYTFQEMVLYYLIAILLGRAARGPDMGAVSVDIYDGSLSRYLLYPFSFFGYKFASHLTFTFLGWLQILISLLLFQPFSPTSFAMGTLSLLLSTLFYYTLTTTLELFAFWTEGVWSLLVMLRFCVSFLGGQMIPLTVMPEGLSRAISYTPFPYMLSIPANTFLGKVSFENWIHSLIIEIAWISLALAARSILWKRGLKQYSGVGI